jgi:CRP-like cAMP-binding protein
MEVAKLEKGRFFGEQALINEDSIRTATMVADTAMKCLVLHRDQFVKLKGALDVLLLISEKLPLLKGFNQTQRRELREQMEEKVYKTGEPISSNKARKDMTCSLSSRVAAKWTSRQMMGMFSLLQS